MTGDARRGRDRDDSGSRTRRVVVLLALGVVCALVLAPPLRLYIEQQQDIAALRSDIAQREADVAALETEVGLWDDDAYVAAQARERLNFVMPGETGYVVPDPEPSAPAASAERDVTPGLTDVESVLRPDAPPEGTWYDRLWTSVEAVGTGTLDPVLDEPDAALVEDLEAPAEPVDGPVEPAGDASAEPSGAADADAPEGSGG